MIWILFFVKNISKILSGKYSQKLMDHGSEIRTSSKNTSETWKINFNARMEEATENLAIKIK